MRSKNMPNTSFIFIHIRSEQERERESESDWESEKYSFISHSFLSCSMYSGNDMKIKNQFKCCVQRESPPKKRSLGKRGFCLTLANLVHLIISNECIILICALQAMQWMCCFRCCYSCWWKWICEFGFCILNWQFIRWWPHNEHDTWAMCACALGVHSLYTNGN